MAEDKKLTQLVINELTKAQYEALGDNVNEDEIYVITDDEVEIKSDGTTIVGKGTTENPLAISTELQGQITTNASDLSSHASNTSNPHGVTKAQVGLGNVDNTSDANKPISTATQNALDDLSEQINTNAEGIAEQGEKITSLETNKASVTDLTSHTGNKSNPHGVTAAQVGLGNVDNTSDANKPISTATQAALDLKANAADLTSHTSNTSNPHSVTKAQVGLGNVDNTADLDKPISTKTQAALNDKADKSDTYTKAEVDAKVSSVYRFKGTVAAETNLPTSDNTTGDVYNVEATGANYAWDGTDWDKLSETVDLTPYLTKEDATKTYETIENANLHKNNTSNPHNVTKTQVGLGNVDNTSDANKPISTATQTALDKKQDTLTAGTNITITGATISAKDTTYTAGDGIKIENGIISNTRVSVEWSNVTGDITEQEDLQNALNLKADKSDTYTKSEVDGAIKTVDDKVQKNTEDIATLNTNKANVSDLTSHTSNTSNPHSVTKAQVGLGNVDNTSDSSKPVSTLQQAALDLKADKATTYTKTEVDGKIKAVDDKAEKNSEDIVAQGNLITNLESNKASASDLTAHATNTSNPHNVTAAQVGLGNVDNTSDADKPISTATQSALDEKQDTLTAGTNITITGTTISAKDTTYTAGDGISITDGVISNTRASAEWGSVAGDITEQEDLQNALALKANQSTTYTKTEVDNKVKTVDDKVANNTQEIATIKNSKADSSDLSSHTSNTSNPHEVTAAQIGLGNVDNTSDADKPISTATQTALDLKADKSTTYTKSQTDAAIKVVSDKVTTNTASITSLNQSVEALQGSKADTTDLSSHTSNVSNPHGVTKAQVGLGNVDNTSDLAKPISTATQNALDAKQNALTAGTGIKLDTDTVSITDDVVTNQTQATSGSFSVGNTTGKNTGSNSTHINSVRTINQAGAISIGHFAETTGAYGIGIGFSATAGYNSVGIGYNADAVAKHSVQLGDGINNNENTLQFRDYPLVDAGGNIYSDRLIGNAVTKYLEMPSVSSKYNNIIVQYVGATTDEYINGYFYKGSYIVANTYTVEENQVGFSISSIDANKLMDWFTEAVQPSTPLDFTKKFVIGVAEVGGYLELYYNYDETYGDAEYRATIYSMDSSEHGIEYAVDESLLYDISEHIKLAEITISITDASWKQINVQPLQDLSGYAEKTTIQQIQQTLGTKADKSDTYTKAEVDAKVSSVYRFMGSVASIDALPADATVGDTYNVETTGANYAWTGAAWDKLSETIDLTPYLTKENAVKTYETIENVNLHKNNTSNPHKVTAAQVGLGNVNNTADLDKPISTATQAALDGKQNTLTQAQLNAVNSGITAAKVSKYDNYATEIAGKQPTGDYATNTALSQGLDGKVDKNQGVASAGKVLAVNEQGVVEPTEIKAGGVNATYNEENHRITFA